MTKQHNIYKILKENDMGKLVIDQNSVYEIDEECVKKNKPNKDCGIYEYLNKEKNTKEEK